MNAAHRIIVNQDPPELFQYLIKVLKYIKVEDNVLISLNSHKFQKYSSIDFPNDITLSEGTELHNKWLYQGYSLAGTDIKNISPQYDYFPYNFSKVFNQTPRHIRHFIGQHSFTVLTKAFFSSLCPHAKTKNVDTCSYCKEKEQRSSFNLPETEELFQNKPNLDKLIDIINKSTDDNE